ncbi:MAG: hypothetical protein ISS54_07025 [Dehalococcoidia bacterium]|nr:hypothetical protein [Dehalococcoidia bacterium]
MLDEIKTELAMHIERDMLSRVFEHYAILKTSFRLQDWEKCLVRAGKFGEAVMKTICFIRTGKVAQQISVDTEINEVNKRSDLPESIRLLIPRAVRVLYDHRSRRGGAHGSFDPNAMDCTMIVPIADWIVGEFVRLYCTVDPDRAMKFVIDITTKSIPIVERIGEDYVVLQKGVSARQEISYILYTRYPNRTRNNQLMKWIPNHSSANIRSSLINMGKAKLVHCNSDGVVLTTAGIRAVENEISTEQSVSSFVS